MGTKTFPTFHRRKKHERILKVIIKEIKIKTNESFHFIPAKSIKI